MTISCKLLARLRQNLDTFDEGLEAFRRAMPLSQEWIQREWLLAADANPARNLLVGAKVSFLEAGTAWAIGSNRGAASSLRSYVENAFAWLYYKDHTVEFRAVVERRMDMMLPKAVQVYMKTVDPGFEKALDLITKKGKR